MVTAQQHAIRKSR